MEKIKDEQSRKVKELEKQLKEERQKIQEYEQRWSEMQADDENEEWEDYDLTSQWYQEEAKGTSSKDSSFVIC